MKQKESERRKHRAIAPYLFFLFQIAVLVEFNYIIINLLGLNTIIVYLLIGLNLYVLLHCFHRLVDVLERSNLIKSYNKYSIH